MRNVETFRFSTFFVQDDFLKFNTTTIVSMLTIGGISAKSILISFVCIKKILDSMKLKWVIIPIKSNTSYRVMEIRTRRLHMQLFRALLVQVFQNHNNINVVCGFFVCFKFYSGKSKFSSSLCPVCSCFFPSSWFLLFPWPASLSDNSATCAYWSRLSSRQLIRCLWHFP